jgi:hypothetical protein
MPNKTATNLFQVQSIPNIELAAHLNANKRSIGKFTNKRVQKLCVDCEKQQNRASVSPTNYIKRLRPASVMTAMT